MAAVQRTAEGVTFWVRLTPKGGRDAIEGWIPMGDDVVLKARVRAVPEDGKANVALIRLLAKQFRVANSSVQIVGGATSRKKRIAICGESDALEAQLQSLEDHS